MNFFLKMYLRIILLFILFSLNIVVLADDEVESVVIGYNLSMLKGNMYKIEPTLTPQNAAISEISWSSSDTSIVSVNDGFVTALKVGKAIIFVNINRKTASCEITVKENYDDPEYIKTTYKDLKTQENGHLIIPVGMKHIPCDMFAGREDIKSVVIHSNVEFINGGAFQNCSSIKEVTIQNGCSEIVGMAFCGCTKLQKITIPPSVKKIGSYAIPTDAIMIVEKGSRAEMYARNHNITYVYNENEISEKKKIGPLLQTHWSQPIDYFYSEEKYGNVAKKKGLCETVAWGQVLNYLNINPIGTQSYTILGKTYYRNFDENKVPINKLPAYYEKGRRDSASLLLCKYLENIAYMLEHDWRYTSNDKGPIEENLLKYANVQVQCISFDKRKKSNIKRMIYKSLQAGVPIVADIEKLGRSGHAVVIDGVRIYKGKFEVHLDFGWGGIGNQWVDPWSNFIVCKGESDYCVAQGGIELIYLIVSIKE